MVNIWAWLPSYQSRPPTWQEERRDAEKDGYAEPGNSVSLSSTRCLYDESTGARVAPVCIVFRPVSRRPSELNGLWRPRRRNWWKTRSLLSSFVAGTRVRRSPRLSKIWYIHLTSYPQWEIRIVLLYYSHWWSFTLGFRVCSRSLRRWY